MLYPLCESVTRLPLSYALRHEGGLMQTSDMRQEWVARALVVDSRVENLTREIVQVY